MSEEIKEFLETCPKCGEALDKSWSVCPLCGLRIKPEDNLIVRSFIWGGVSVAFVLMYLAIAKNDPDLAAGFAVVFGIPLAYVFGKAVLFRLSGKPLTLAQLGRSSFRVGVVTILVVVVAPILIGLALLLLVFAVCASGGNFH